MRYEAMTGLNNEQLTELVTRVHAARRGGFVSRGRPYALGLFGSVALTFDAGSAAVKPEFDATIPEIARTVKTHSQTFVDVFAHTDLSGTPQVNQALSDKRAAAVATYLAAHGVARARIASTVQYR